MPVLALFVIVLAAAIGLSQTDAEAASVKRTRPDRWPANWPAPPAEFMPAVAEASKKYQVPADYLVAFGFIETRFEPWVMGKVRPATWAKIKDKVIGKSGKTWSQAYTESDMRAVGIMGVMPFNFIGVDGGLPVGTSVRSGLPIRFNVRMAARLLRLLYLATGDWVSALHGYNPGGGEDYYQKLCTAINVYQSARSTT
jgi:hypothetical protein